MLKINQRVIKTLFFALILSLTIKTGISQDLSPTNSFWNKFSYGGGIGLGFGNNTFNASISPSAIYNVNEQLAMGVGINFNYSKFEYSKLFAYGGSLMTFYNPIRLLQLSAEFQQLRVNRNYETLGGNGIKEDYWSPALFLGAGYNSRNVTIGIKYDLLYNDDDSIYNSPWTPFIRVYF